MWCCAVDFSAKPTYEEASVMELIALLWDQANDLLMCWAWHPKTSVFMSSVTCVAFDTFDDIPQCTVCSLIYSICYFAVFRIYELVHPVCTFVQECEPLVCVCVCVCPPLFRNIHIFTIMLTSVPGCVPLCLCASVPLYFCTFVPLCLASVLLYLYAGKVWRRSDVWRRPSAAAKCHKVATFLHDLLMTAMCALCSVEWLPILILTKVDIEGRVS